MIADLSDTCFSGNNTSGRTNTTTISGVKKKGVFKREIVNRP